MKAVLFRSEEDWLMKPQITKDVLVLALLTKKRYKQSWEKIAIDNKVDPAWLKTLVYRTFTPEGLKMLLNTKHDEEITLMLNGETYLEFMDRVIETFLKEESIELYQKWLKEREFYVGLQNLKENGMLDEYIKLVKDRLEELKKENKDTTDLESLLEWVENYNKV
jgi:hypothetical protein